MPRPDFIVIGAQKSGSSALVRALSDHPQVLMPETETRHFRNPWYAVEPHTVLDVVVAGGGPGIRRRGIKSPDYMPQPYVPGRVAEHLGHVDLVAVLREPVARTLSAYFWAMQWGLLPVVHPDVGLARLLDGWTSSRYPRAREVLEYGRYASHLRHWLNSGWAREKLLVLLDDDLRSDPDHALGEVWRFLGVETGLAPAHQQRLVNEGVYSLHRLRWLQSRLALIMRPFPGHPGRYLRREDAPIVARTVDAAIVSVDRILLRRWFGNKRPELDPTVQERLRSYYAADVQDLGTLLGRPVPAGWVTADG